MSRNRRRTSCSSATRSSRWGICGCYLTQRGHVRPGQAALAQEGGEASEEWRGLQRGDAVLGHVGDVHEAARRAGLLIRRVAVARIEGGDAGDELGDRRAKLVEI